jgi:hypothetical protein
MHLSDVIRFYSDKRVQRHIISVAKHREVVARYTDKVGTRPDVLLYENDIMDFVKRGATSFHASMERWTNPLFLEHMKTRKEMDSIRQAWDLVLDVDSQHLKYAKVCAKLLADAIEFHGISNYSIKFSGGTGFHIGIPFESFPQEINGTPTKNLFPDAPRVIAEYLKQMISEQLADKLLELEDVKQVMRTTGKGFNDIVKEGRFDPYSVITIDTVALSSRHLFRMPYTFNEKKWLISVPLKKSDIDGFDTKQAEYKNVVPELGFLDKHEPGEARQLFVQAFDWNQRSVLGKTEETEYEIPKEAIQMKFFPQNILKLLNGLEDGRKRGLFILLNFLRSCGWDYDSIAKEIATWNNRNREPLRESYINSQVNWHKRLKGSYLPPNCDNKNYYSDIGVPCPIPNCSSNPVVHAMRLLRGRGRAPKQQKKGKVNV